jgi:Domain of unknown function (DUF2383)
MSAVIRLRTVNSQTFPRGIDPAKEPLNPLQAMKPDSLSPPRDPCIDICNGFLRGELAAVETYGQAIEKYADSPVTDELRRIRSDHVQSANSLSANVRHMGGEPETDSGAWGMLAKTVQGAANLFGRNSAIESLHQGEVTGRNAYQEALLDDNVLADCKLLIREGLLPPVIEHITTLEKLEHAV